MWYGRLLTIFSCRIWYNIRMTVQKVVRKTSLQNQVTDFEYWQSQSPQARLQALEEIRLEYHQWKYGTQPRFQRVYTIVKR
jgi:hypothetical protein